MLRTALPQNSAGKGIADRNRTGRGNFVGAPPLVHALRVPACAVCSVSAAPSRRRRRPARKGQRARLDRRCTHGGSQRARGVRIAAPATRTCCLSRGRRAPLRTCARRGAHCATCADMRRRRCCAATPCCARAKARCCSARTTCSITKRRRVLQSRSALATAIARRPRRLLGPPRELRLTPRGAPGCESRPFHRRAAAVRAPAARGGRGGRGSQAMEASPHRAWCAGPAVASGAAADPGGDAEHAARERGGAQRAGGGGRVARRGGGGGG